MNGQTAISSALNLSVHKGNVFWDNDALNMSPFRSPEATMFPDPSTHNIPPVLQMLLSIMDSYSSRVDIIRERPKGPK